MEVIRLEILLIAFGIVWGSFGLSLLLHGLFGPVRTKRTIPVPQALPLRSPDPRWVSPLSR